MKKNIIFVVILVSLTVYNCSEENQEVYSCDEKLNEWAHKNVKEIRLMNRNTWLKLDEQYKRPAFNALTPEQKIQFWKAKLTEVMISFDWSEAEMKHLTTLYTYFEEHPDMYTEKVMNDSLASDTFARFCYRWRNDAMIDLDWTEEQIYAIACTGNRMINKEGEYETVTITRKQTKVESTTQQDCDCSTLQDKNCIRNGCNSYKGGIANNEYIIDGRHEKQ